MKSNETETFFDRYVVTLRWEDDEPEEKIFLWMEEAGKEVAEFLILGYTWADVDVRLETCTMHVIGSEEMHASDLFFG